MSSASLLMIDDYAISFVLQPMARKSPVTYAANFTHAKFLIFLMF